MATGELAQNGRCNAVVAKLVDLEKYDFQKQNQT
jgi:hypothetical protein